MRHIFIPALAATLLGLLVGCADTPDSAAPQAAEEPGVEGVGSSKHTESVASAAEQESTSLTDVGQKLGEAAEVTGDFSAARMRTFGKAMQTKVEELGDELEELSHEGEELAGDAKKQWQERVSKLEARRKNLQEDIAQLQNASSDAWQSLKKGIDNAWTDLKGAVEETSADTPGIDAGVASSAGDSKSSGQRGE